MTDICREFGILRKTGYRLYQRYRAHGLKRWAIGRSVRCDTPTSYRPRAGA